MKTVPAALATHLSGRVTRLRTCWKVVRRDSVVVRGTESDRDIVIAAGDYAGTYPGNAGITGSIVRKGSDLAVGNMEVEGSLVSLVTMEAADIEAGLFDDAEVTLFVVNALEPNDGQVVQHYGNLGNIQRTSEGRYTAELRGLNQKLAQNVLRTSSPTCDAILGDVRCGKDISGMILAATVSSVTSRRRFNVTLPGADSSTVERLYDGGKLTGLTGDNAGFAREVRRASVGDIFGHLEVWEPFPATPEAGDTFSLAPGCDKELSTCRDDYDNVLRFRGPGVYTPGLAKMIKGPDRGSGPVG